MYRYECSISSFIIFIKNYHFADINLFWKDIQENALIRTDNWFKINPGVSGIYNVGTGKSRTFNDIANCVLDYYKKGSINYINFPDNLEGQYQAFTEANMSKIKTKGYSDNFINLEEGVKSYLDWLSKKS